MGNVNLFSHYALMAVIGIVISNKINTDIKNQNMKKQTKKPEIKVPKKRGRPKKDWPILGNSKYIIKLQKEIEHLKERNQALFNEGNTNLGLAVDRYKEIERLTAIIADNKKNEVSMIKEIHNEICSPDKDTINHNILGIKFMADSIRENQKEENSRQQCFRYRSEEKYQSNWFKRLFKKS